MQILEYYRQNKDRFGRKTALKMVIQRGLQRILGVDRWEAETQRQQEELDTLFFFFNEYSDITKVPVAKGGLRK